MVRIAICLLLTAVVLNRSGFAQQQDSIIVERTPAHYSPGKLNLDLCGTLGYHPLASLGFRMYLGYSREMIMEVHIGTNYPVTSLPTISVVDVLTIKFDTSTDAGGVLSLIAALDMPGSGNIVTNVFCLAYGHQFFVSPSKLVLLRGGLGASLLSYQPIFGRARDIVHPAFTLEASLILKLLGNDFR